MPSEKNAHTAKHNTRCRNGTFDQRHTSTLYKLSSIAASADSTEGARGSRRTPLLGSFNINAATTASIRPGTPSTKKVTRQPKSSFTQPPTKLPMKIPSGTPSI
jgi:hypothetical protein